ncbi:desmoglein-3-like protein [Lates japonicus]|uniref:Desmoglein-3-like protein n=1 Tax=Lates japonicus TaxID=270547 RepID=A0AAD3NHZ1_LATJO|nr:desmoglein-3-like protein [Lates japonicus]
MLKESHRSRMVKKQRIIRRIDFDCSRAALVTIWDTCPDSISAAHPPFPNFVHHNHWQHMHLACHMLADSLKPQAPLCEISPASMPTSPASTVNHMSTTHYPGLLLAARIVASLVDAQWQPWRLPLTAMNRNVISAAVTSATLTTLCSISNRIPGPGTLFNISKVNLTRIPDSQTAERISIRSDWDEERTLYYTLLGHGASKEPVNLFIVEETTGLVRIRGTLDREERETYIVRLQFGTDLITQVLTY